MAGFIRHVVRPAERGAIVIVVAVSMMVMLGFVAFAVDYGVFWLARAQAQNAADSAAMAAAISWAFDVPDADNEDASQALKDEREMYARESAVQLGTAHKIFSAAPAVDGSTDITVPVGTSTGCPANVTAINCLRVNVYRDSVHSNPLPTFFGRLLGVHSQDMRATAVAGVVVANASDCMAPIALPDRWQEWDDGEFKQKDSKYRIYDWDDKNDTVKNRKDPDTYVPPGNGGTGYRRNDSSTKKLFTIDDVSMKTKKDKTLEQIFAEKGVKSSGYVILDIPRSDGQSGLEGYAANFASCNGQIVRVNDVLHMLNAADKKSQTELNEITFDAIQALFDLDPNAVYKNGRIIDSNLSKNGMSPRVLNVPLFDVKYFTDCMTGVIDCDAGGEVKVVNIVGLFVGCEVDKKKLDCKVKTDGKFKTAIIPSVGTVVGDAPPIDPDFSFLRAMAFFR